MKNSTLWKENGMRGIFEKKDVNIVAKKLVGFQGFPSMFHNHVEIFYVMRGTIHMMIDGVSHILSEGEISIVFPYSIHSYEDAPEAEVMMLLFSPAVVGMFEKALLSHRPENPYISNMQACRPMIEKIVTYAEQEDMLYEKTMGAYLTALMGEILLSLHLVRVETTDLNATQQILSYCSSHYTEAITVQKVANALYLSESYITKIFSGKLGHSFREYINTLRIAKAKNLLKKTDMKIIDVMYTCGFSNQSSFNRIFQEMTAMTPRAYREHKVKTC